MIVYHLTESDNVKKYLSDGLKRSEKRFYVFKKWSYIELILEGIIFDYQISPDIKVDNYNVLVLNLDEDVLEPGPIPKVRIPTSISEQGKELLQANSIIILSGVF